MPSAPTSIRPTAWEWAQVALLSASLAWTTLCLGGFLAETMVVTAGLNGLLLLVHFSARFHRAGATARAHPAGKWLLPFLCYALANVLWVTPVRWRGWQDWLEWAQMIGVFWVVLNGVRSQATRAALLRVLMGLGAVAVALQCYQRWVQPDWMMLGRTQAEQFISRSSGPFGIPNSMAAFLLLLLPAAGTLALRRRTGAFSRLLYGGLAIVFAVGLVLTISRGAWLGLALALAAWPLFATGRHWFWRLGAALIVVASVLAAGAALYFTLPKVKERLDLLVRDMGEKTRPIMWRGAWRIFQDHPVFGGGAGAYDMLFEKYRPEHYQDEPNWAHNDYLNTLSDYGLTGFVLFFGAGAVVLGCCLRGAARDPNSSGQGLEDPLVVQALAIGMLAFAFQLLVDFHLKIPALAMMLATVAGLIVQRAWPVPETGPTPIRRERIAAMAAFAGILAMTAMFALPHYRGESIRYGMRREIDDLARHPVSAALERPVMLRAREVFGRATSVDPANGQAWADRAYATALWSHHEPVLTAELGREAEIYARRALALSQVVPEFWLRLGVALDMQGNWVAAGAAFTEAQNLAPSAALPWYYQAFHLAKNPTYRGIAKVAVATSLRLDPGNREAEALRQRLAGSR